MAQQSSAPPHSPIAPPSPTHAPSSVPPLSPLLALFPSPSQARLALASYFAAPPPAWSTPAAHAAAHASFVAEMDAPAAGARVDFGWLALLFAVVGVGAVEAEPRAGARGVGAIGMGRGELWVRGAVALLELAGQSAGRRERRVGGQSRC